MAYKGDGDCDDDHNHNPKPIKIECVIVCVNYSDFLAHTLPHNKQYFNKLVVVTDTKDLKTKRLCDFYNVECVQTDVFYTDGDKFNKGKGINAGLARLEKDGWVLHLDADIFLPSLTRSILENAHLSGECLYGIDRMMCRNYREWIKFIESPILTHTAWVYVYPTIFEMGVRVAKYKTDGYIPIGFFQLWNPRGSGIYAYPQKHDGAARTDMQFALLWPRSKRGLIPELIAIHLESESYKDMGANWNGRKTKLFAADIQKKSWTKKLADWWDINIRNR